MSERAAASNPTPSLTADSESVFVEFHRRLRAFVSRRVGTAADVDDVLQETFLRIHRKLGGLRSADRLSAWVFQVARSAIVDHYRRRRPSEPLGDNEWPTDDREDTASVPARELEELAGCLAPMVASLPKGDREAIELSEIQGLTQREASSRAGVSLSGMKSRVQRARRKLKVMLQDCCRIELDRRGGIVSHEPREGACEPCRPSDVRLRGARRARRC